MSETKVLLLTITSSSNFHSQIIATMSHFTKIKTKLYDRATIEKSLSDLNIEWESGLKQINGYNNQKHEAEIIIRQKNDHDIGFKWNGTEYELVTDLDLWNFDLPVERFISKITQMYAYHTIIAKTEDDGYQIVEQKNQNDGSIELVLTKWEN